MNAMPFHRLLRLGLAIAALGASPAWAATVDFAKEIQPIFEANCVKCTARRAARTACGST